MRTVEFFKDLEISEEDTVRAQKAIYSKGIEKHILIMEYLLNWRSVSKIKYAEIATTNRYDKRIRNVLYKYISYLEEFFRANILDSYINRIDQIFWIPKLKSLLEKNRQNLNAALESLSFRDLLKQMIALPEEIKDKCLFVKTHLKQNVDALVDLRNAVMHNKFLVLYKGFKFCYIDNRKDAGLKSNIMNLVNFLPQGVRDQAIADVNVCRKKGDNIDKTKWVLPTQITINLNESKSNEEFL